jgi:hypothetical protein
MKRHSVSSKNKDTAYIATNLLFNCVSQMARGKIGGWELCETYTNNSEKMFITAYSNGMMWVKAESVGEDHTYSFGGEQMKQEIKDLCQSLRNGECDGADLMKLWCELENQDREIELLKAYLSRFISPSDLIRLKIHSSIVNHTLAEQEIDAIAFGEYINHMKQDPLTAMCIIDDPQNEDDFEKLSGDEIRDKLIAVINRHCTPPNEKLNTDKVLISENPSVARDFLGRVIRKPHKSIDGMCVHEKKLSEQCEICLNM